MLIIYNIIIIILTILYYYHTIYERINISHIVFPERHLLQSSKWFINQNCSTLKSNSRRTRVTTNYSSTKTIIIITTDVLHIKQKNCINMMSVFMREYNIIPVVFSNSPVVRSFCKQVGITSYKTLRQNEYEYPYLKDMLLFSRNHYFADFYIYINSDILFSPSYFSILTSIKELFRSIPYLLCSRVYETIKPSLLNFTSIREYRKELHNQTLYRIRKNSGIDLFIFPRRFPFHLIPDVVVGRWYIDSVIMNTCHNYNISMIEVTSIPSYHQGVDRSAINTKANGTRHSFYWNKELCTHFGWQRHLNPNYMLCNKGRSYLSTIK